MEQVSHKDRLPHNNQSNFIFDESFLVLFHSDTRVVLLAIVFQCEVHQLSSPH